MGAGVGVGAGVAIGAGVAVGTGVMVGAGVAVGAGVMVGAGEETGAGVGGKVDGGCVESIPQPKVIAKAIKMRNGTKTSDCLNLATSQSMMRM